MLLTFGIHLNPLVLDHQLQAFQLLLLVSQIGVKMSLYLLSLLLRT